MGSILKGAMKNFFRDRLTRREIQAAEQRYNEQSAKEKPQPPIKEPKRTDPRLAKMRRRHGTYHVIYIVEGFDEFFHIKVARTRWGFKVSKHFVEAFVKLHASQEHQCGKKHVHIVSIEEDT